MTLRSTLQGFFSTIGTELWVADPFFRSGLTPQVWRIINSFRQAGALHPRAAQRYFAHTPQDAEAFRLLLRQRVIRECEPGRYYLNQQALYERRWWRGSQG